MAEVTDTPSERTPTDDWRVGHMRLLRKLEAMGRTIEANAMAGGNASIVAEMRRRHGYIASAKREVAAGWLRARRHTPTHAARPRPRVRARRTRTASRRASGLARSGSDPGGREGGEAEGDGPLPGAVARPHRWLDNRRDPWRVHEAPLGLWRIRAAAVRLVARWRGLP